MFPKWFSSWIMIKDIFAPCCGTWYGDSWGVTDIQCLRSPFSCDFISSHRPTTLAEQLKDAAVSLLVTTLSLCRAMRCKAKLPSFIRQVSLSPSLGLALRPKAASSFPVALLSRLGEKRWMLQHARWLRLLLGLVRVLMLVIFIKVLQAITKRHREI